MSLRADFDSTFEVAQELGVQLEQAQFLFAGNVRDRLRAAADEADDLLAEREKLRELRAGENQDELQMQLGKVRQMTTKLRTNLANLAEDMGDEMKLYIPRAQASATS